MCKDCGCSTGGDVQIHTDSDSLHSYDPGHHPGHHHPRSHDPGHHHPGHFHPHEHSPRTNGHHHSHPETLPTSRTLQIGQSVLDKNDRLAERNRGYFLAKHLWVMNLLSSPGSGKTTFLAKTLTDLQDDLNLGVIVGDLETDRDAQRLRNGHTSVVQITTGAVCHLEADMVMSAAQHMDLDALDGLVIENVGNLVCPAAYDLGESQRVVLLSVTEGEDKPLKYPTMFKSADLVIISKIDIATAVGFDRSQAIAYLHQVAPQATILEVSARTGEGMDQWYAYLKAAIQAQQPRSLSAQGT